MQRTPARYLSIAAIWALGTMLTGCAAEIRDTVMGGDADGVAIQFAGDINATLPLAQQYCAQYDRVPHLRDTNDDIVHYACLRR